MKKSRTYLAGPIDRVAVKEAMQWRDMITVELEQFGIDTLNPFGQFGGDRLSRTRKHLGRWNDNGELSKIRKFVKDTVIPPDLKMVEECDFLTIYVPHDGKEICGSYGEATLAFYLGKPVYVVTRRDLKPVNLPNWLIGLSDEIFTSWLDYLQFIEEKWSK
jgi:hypothetical protein